MVQSEYEKLIALKLKWWKIMSREIFNSDNIGTHRVDDRCSCQRGTSLKWTTFWNLGLLRFKISSILLHSRLWKVKKTVKNATSIILILILIECYPKLTKSGASEWDRSGPAVLLLCYTHVWSVFIRATKLCCRVSNIQEDVVRSHVLSNYLSNFDMRMI